MWKYIRTYFPYAVLAGIFMIGEVSMALAGAPGTQLTEVEVVLYQRDHTRQQEPLLAFSQSIRLHADRAQQDIHGSASAGHHEPDCG